MKQTISTIVATLAVLILLVIGFAYSGIYDVAATRKDSGVIHWLLETTRDRSIDSRGEDIQVPKDISLDDPKLIAKGFDHYNEMCVVCHGAPGMEPGEARAGLNPKPPLLAKRTEDIPAGELFWVIKHGIKMTGMPAWGPTHSDDKIWAIAAFVEKLPGITPAQYQALKKSAAARGSDDE
jgi:mono/diheme cytochrome c family protein